MSYSDGDIFKKIYLAKSIFEKGKRVDDIDEYFNSKRELSEKEAEEAADLLREAKEKYEKAYKSWLDSHNYRVAIKEYSEELNKWNDELKEKENEIQAKIDNILGEAEKEKENAHKKRIEELDALKKEVLKEQQTLEEMKVSFKEFDRSLQRAELKTLQWLRSNDNKQVLYFKEMAGDIQRYIDCEVARNTTRSEIYSDMDGDKFEQHIANVLIANGFQKVEVTQKTRDFGADVLAEQNGIKYVVQCKYYSSPIGVDAVQQIVASRIHYKANVAIVATNNIFTTQAKILAQENNVVLWDCVEIAKMEEKLFEK